MKHLSLIALLVFANFASATIYVMDSSEFNTIEHKKARWMYVKQIAPILSRLNVKIPSYDPKKTDYYELYEVIQTPKWDAMVPLIDKSCAKPDLKKPCESLENARLNLFDYIKGNPEAE